MVYLKDSFIVSLFIHNMALLPRQAVVAVTTGAGVENPKKSKKPVVLILRNLKSWYLTLPCLNCLTFFLAVFFQIMVLV